MEGNVVQILFDVGGETRGRVNQRARHSSMLSSRLVGDQLLHEPGMWGRSQSHKTSPQPFCARQDPRSSPCTHSGAITQEVGPSPRPTLD